MSPAVLVAYAPSMRQDDGRTSQDDHEAAVAAFGERVVATGFDQTLDEMDLALDGRMRYPGAAEIEAGFRALGPDQQAYVRRLIANVVATTVHNTLWAIEKLPWVTVVATNDETGATTDISLESDGLTLALEAWFETYARHPRAAFGEDR